MMPRLHLIAAAAMALSGFVLVWPASAAPRPCAAIADCATHAHYNRQDDRRYRDEDRSRDRDWDRDRRDHGDWDRDHSRYRWEYQRDRHWRLKRHPRHDHWVGRSLPPHGPYMVILDYRSYGLSRPRPGYAYVRVDRDVYLIAEATRRIIDAFVLLDAAGR